MLFFFQLTKRSTHFKEMLVLKQIRQFTLNYS
jgi:hypothetical protein